MWKPTRHRLQQLCLVVGFWVISIFVAMTLLELVSWAILAGHHWLGGDGGQASQVSPAYGDAPWVADFRREEHSRLQLHSEFLPFVIWGNREWHGKYMNTDVTHLGIWRRTVNPDVSTCGNRSQLNVWVFGGSTVFGTGVPDWATLPSFLSHSLNAAGHACAIVTNFGQEGFVSTQELILLMEKLKEAPHPDIVVFYDGFNDAMTGMYAPDPRTAYFGADTLKPRVEGTVAGRLDFIRKFHSFLLLHGLGTKLRGKSFPAYRQHNATVTVDNYRENIEMARALSRSYHFAFFSFFQPFLFYGHKPPVPFEQRMVDAAAAGKGPLDPRPLAMVYDEVQRRGSSLGSVNLTGMFDSVPEAVYLDQAHLGPRGNELAAKAIARYLEEYFPGGTQHADPVKEN